MKFEVYADDFYLRNEFLGIGCLFVPVDKKVELVNSLINKRCLGKSGNYKWNYGDCSFNGMCKKQWHDLNNCEIHYRTLDSSSSHPKKEISGRWVDFLIKNNLENLGLVYFKILYINLSNLDENCFGDENARENMYNRFFRTIIKGSRFFFGPELKEIVKIYHHKGENHEIHSYFPWHVGTRLNIDEDDFFVVDEEIKFIESDHKIYFGSDDDLSDESNIIQFVDLIIGVMSRNIFDGLSNDPTKIILAEKVRDLTQRLLISPKNRNSRYNYYRKQDISFYPKNKLEIQPLFEYLDNEKGEDNFYRVQKLARIPRIDTNNGPLDIWLK
ncbi:MULTISPECIES: hypothetical protein [Methanobacterium]|uniref:DUF3800 domain-containing protein n=1 Tax=Methanobacterium bryantii TaxID=2161 RepID=A0A2A2H6R5_METBR|nr:MULTISPECIES: hypothetical protein [Methanobacterium]OEC84938.1 hypothetical protein A9507_00995 [Methanobacterium sp. A39]PAV05087.1 hypothetical protein ASJ80_12415 [Methanobacterium bryantii]